MAFAGSMDVKMSGILDAANDVDIRDCEMMIWDGWWSSNKVCCRSKGLDCNEYACRNVVVRLVTNPAFGNLIAVNGSSFNFVIFYETYCFHSVKQGIWVSFFSSKREDFLELVV